jgi:hypothetical protein
VGGIRISVRTALWTVLGDRCEELDRVADTGEQLDVGGLLQQAGDALAYELAFVGEHDPHCDPPTVGLTLPRRGASRPPVCGQQYADQGTGEPSLAA